MPDRHCDIMADHILAALELRAPGAVRGAVERHVPTCGTCRERLGALRALADGLDPAVPAAQPGFVGRVMSEIRGEETRQVAGAYDRLPPLWQVLGAGGLLVALAAVVLATGTHADAWHSKALTGFLEQSLGFLGGLSAGITGLWDAIVPGRGLPILAGLAALATALNVAFVVGAMRRHGKTVE